MNKRIVKCSTPIVDVSGEIVPMSGADPSPFTLGKALVGAMRQSKKMDALKVFLLAGEFYKNDEAKIDDADFAFIKEAIQECIIDKYIAGQMIHLLESAEKVEA